MSELSIPKIVKKLVKLQNEYCSVPRAIVTRERYYNLIGSGLLKEFSFDLVAIKEPLIEHVGHLPIIAVYLHQKIKHRQVDLGRVLIMLAVHDIGETVTGDILAYRKTLQDGEKERIIARKKLPKELVKYFDEFEEVGTLDAKFAQSIDAIAPILHEYLIPEICVDRMNHFKFCVEDIRAKKQKYFEWDPVLKKVFAYLIRKLKQVEKAGGISTNSNKN